MQIPSATPLVHFEESAGVLTVTLDNPTQGNEITAPMFEALQDALAQAAARPATRVLRLRARGAAFCTGRERAGTDAASLEAEVRRLIALKRTLRASPLLTVAEMQGDAHGFGLGLAMLCDFTLVSSAATLAFPEMRKGLPPAAIMAYLGRYAAPKAAFPLVLFGEAFPPARALAAGLVTEVCEPEALAMRTEALVDRLLALDADGARACKAYFLAAQEGTVEQNFELATGTLVMHALRLRDAARR